MKYKSYTYLLLVAVMTVFFAGCGGGGGNTGGEKTLVSIAVTSTNPSIALGTTQQFTATGTFSDNTTQDLTASATWSSSNTSVATISNAAGTSGKATTVAAGTSTITVTSGNISGSTTLTVTPATLVSIAVTPTNPSIALGTTQQFNATGTFTDNTTQDLTASATWSSSTPSVATISNAAGTSGKATTVAAGTSTITATTGNISGLTSLTVTPATLVSIAVTPTNPSIALGTTQQFTASGIFSDNTTQDLSTSVIWSSSATSVATISNAAGTNGKAATVAAGTSTITATSGNLTGSTNLTVTPATLVAIAVTPTNPSIALGTTQQFTATGIFSDNTTQDLTTSVTWSSSSVSVAAISNAAGSKGKASPLVTGPTTITATLPVSLPIPGSISGSTNLTVTPATLVSIAVTPTNPSIALGTTQQFTATGTFTDNTTQDLTTSVTWSLSAASVAAISNAAGSKGKTTSVAIGTATITATSGSISGSTNFTVTPATLVSIAVTPTNPSIAFGTTQQFTATGAFTDNTTQVLTASVTWSSSSVSVAAISNAAGTNGKATSVAVGTATITATSGGISGSTILTVTQATLVSIAVTPTNPSTALGITQQFRATGTFSDNTTQDLTAAVTWSSSSASVAAISNASGSKGMATPVALGTSTITAASGSISGSTTLAVIIQPTRMNITIALNPPIASLGALRFSLISDPGATYNNDAAPINALSGVGLFDARPVGNSLNIAEIIATSVNTLATPIISVSYAITAGTLPGVQVSPVGILAVDGPGLPITPPLTPANFVVTVTYI